MAVNFVCTYFTSLYLSQVNLVVPCWFDQAKIQLLDSCPIRLKFQEKLTFERNANLGMVLDLDCFQNHSWQWIDYSDQNLLFSSKYRWLILSESNDTFTRFLKEMKEVNMNASADISFALIEEKSVTTYQIFNNGKVFGGIFNASLDSKYLCNDDQCKKTFQVSNRTKYSERCLYKDITLNLISVVLFHFYLIS